MVLFFSLVIFLFGLIIGSFINCLVYRLKNKESLSGRSFCPHCKKQINWHDNIPLLSYFLLRAKCRWCRKKISVQYPLVELVTGILFLVVFLATIKQFSNLTIYQFILLGRNWLFAIFLIIIFLYDLKYYLIPDKISLPAMVVALIFNIFLYNIFINYLLAALIAGGFFFLQFIISKGKWIGGGDIRLGLLIGLMLGWPNILVALIISYILGSIIGLGLIIAKRATMKSPVPLGTFLSIGAFISLLWADKIIEWYLNINLYGF